MIQDPLNNLALSIGSIITACGAIASGILIGRRHMSQNRVGFRRDSAEINIIQNLIEERDRSVENNKEILEQLAQISQEKEAAFQVIDELHSEMGKLRRRLRLMRQLVNRLTSTLDMTKAELKHVPDRSDIESPPDQNRDQ